MSLKKEFSKSTVQRMRNIITGNAGERTSIQSGWEKHKHSYTEGDIWEENGKKWTIKNGIKQTLTKFDKYKEIKQLPLKCPTCNTTVKNNDLNKKMFTIHKMCLNCVTAKETKLKIEGKWEDYQSQIINNNKNATLQDFESALESWMQENSSFVAENGDIENWSKVDKTKVYQEIKANIEKFKNTKI